MSQSISEILNKSVTPSNKIAEVCGVTKQTINLWKRGNTVPPKKHLLKLSQAVSIGVDELSAAREASILNRNRLHEDRIIDMAVESLGEEAMDSSDHTDEVTKAIGIELPFSYEQLMGTNTPVLDSHLAVLHVASSIAEFSSADALRCLELASEMREANRNSEKDNTDG